MSACDGRNVLLLPPLYLFFCNFSNQLRRRFSLDKFSLDLDRQLLRRLKKIQEWNLRGRAHGSFLNSESGSDGGVNRGILAKPSRGGDVWKWADLALTIRNFWWWSLVSWGLGWLGSYWSDNKLMEGLPLPFPFTLPNLEFPFFYYFRIATYAESFKF